MNEFTGDAAPFTQGAIEQAARDIGCEKAAIQAVIDVESRGGFLSDKRPKILFERHHFHRHTRGRFSEAYGDISAPASGGYKGGPGEYDRLYRAISLDRAAALNSSSWGAFQILGSNHVAAGFDNVESFCRAMCVGEDAHLRAFVNLARKTRLDHKLRARDWGGFARGYNGPAYRRFDYDRKLSAAFLRHLGPEHRDYCHSETIRLGDKGDDVVRLQQKLGVRVDGIFGPATKRALLLYQEQNRMRQDGIAGPATWRQLEATPI